MPVSESTTDELLVENKGRVVVITLNRPERMNAISRDMLDQLSAKVTEANKDPDVRCIVLTGNGRGFVLAWTWLMLVAVASVLEVLVQVATGQNSSLICVMRPSM